MFVAKRCLIAGRVQGVFYRASTKRQARSLGVAGYAKNLVDGRVEVLAVGEAEQVDALLTWLWEGPPAAQVTAVDVSEVAPRDLEPLPTEFVTL